MADRQRVIVIGCGGIGSHLARGLATSLQFQAPGSTLLLVDGDNFEQKNAVRQQFSKLGNKAKVVQEDLRSLVPDTYVIARPVWIVESVANIADSEGDEDDRYLTAEMLIGEGDHIFCVVDNYAARKLVLDAASKLNNVDVYTGGNGSVETEDALFGSIYHYVRRNGVDITMHPAAMHHEFEHPTDRNPGELSCQERAQLDGGTQLAAINIGVAAFLLARAAIAMFGTDEERQEAYERSEIYFDLKEGGALAYDRRPANIPAIV